MRTLIVTSSLLLSLFVLASTVSAQDSTDEDLRESSGRDSQYGTIDLDLSEEREKSSYSDVQNATISAFNQLRTTARTLAEAGSASVPPLADDMLSYLTAVYLYCAVHNGTCPLVLEAILEVDIMNAKLAGSATCPNMKRFWNAWVASDMEERHKFLVKTSHINTYSEFNTKTRPKFLRCEETVKQEISGPGSGQGFFRDRYRAGAPKEKIFDRMHSLLLQIQEKIPNVFVATGSQPPLPKEQQRATKPKGSGAVRRSAPRR